jgi:hypothetical protein
MSNKEEKAFIRFASETLDQHLEQLDQASKLTLRQARHKALQEPTRSKSAWLPAGAMLATAAAAVLMIVMWPSHDLEFDAQLASQDAELLASDADLDLLAELDFYEWLETENHAG